MSTFPKYKQNQSIVNLDGTEYIKSYDTLVARLNHNTNELIQLGYWSQTTQKHINYAANYMNLNLVINHLK